MAQVTLDQIQSVTTKALQVHGAADWIAESVAHAVRVAEAQGNVICGLYYVESYCKQLVSGRVNGTVEPVVTRAKPSVIEVDAGLGFAQPAFARGLNAAVMAARETGTVTFAIRHAHTCTSLGYFTRQIAQSGLIGIGFTNASAIVAPPGGKDRVLGTNPIAMHVPGPDGQVAFGYDQSTSAIALGKITMAASAGESIPLGWAVDDQGNPTTDPQAALKGALVSTGGYKGWGFGLMVEVLASALTDTASSREVIGLKAPEGAPHDLGQTYLMIDPMALAGQAFHTRIDALRAAVEAQDGARLPGSTPRHLDPVDVPDQLWILIAGLAGTTQT